MLIGAAHTALEDREVALDRVRGHVATGILFAAVNDGFMRAELFADALIEIAFVGMQAALALDVLAHDAGDG